MSKSLIVCFGSDSRSDNGTSFNPIVGALEFSAENGSQIPVRDAGVFSNLFTYANTNTTTTVTSTVTLRKSVADTGVIVTYASAETGAKEDTSNTASFANTDEPAYEITVGNDPAAAAINFTLFGIQFTPTTTTDCVTFLGNIYATGAGTGPNGTTRYYPPVGRLNDYLTNTSETNIEFRTRSSFTSSDFYYRVGTNARVNDTTYGTRKNSANGNQSVTFAAAETGAKEDTSNTDALVAGDDYNYYQTSGAGTELIAQTGACTTCISTSNLFPLLSTGSESVTFNVTEYSGLSGFLSSATTTDAEAQIYPRFDFTAKELVSYVSANTIATSATTVTIRDNVGDSSVVVSYAAAETGLKNDSSNTATITSATDEINYKIVTPNTSGSLTFRWIGCLGESAAETPSSLIQAIMF